MRYNRFKEGREIVNDDARPARPSTSTTDEIVRIIVESLLERLLIMLAYRSAHDKQFLRHETCVLKLLNFKQKHRRMDISQEMLKTFKDDPDLLKKVITGGEL